jgi:tetratricopeptide (TPR) repeat protein
MMFGKRRSSSAKIPFTNSESFRLCTEGLQALERFERQASRTDLEIAESQLGHCVRRYPTDMVPKFYLGSVKTLVGYRGLDEAIMLLTDVVERGPADLKPAAQYNLAVAHIERYDDLSFERAETILEGLAANASRAGKSIRLLTWSARVNLLYIRAHRIWEHRDLRTADDRAAVKLVPGLERAMEEFREELEQSDFKNDRDILADYWNALGTLRETQARFSRDPKQREDFGRLAKDAFGLALESKNDWLDAKSNLARLYYEVIKDPETSRKLWAEVLQVRPDDHYAHYNLGWIDLDEGKREEARDHFRKAAPEIVGAKVALEMLDQEDDPRTIREVVDQRRAESGYDHKEPSEERGLP